MKRLHEIILFSCITIGLMTSAATKMEPGDNFHWNSFADIQNDTTGFLEYISADTFKLNIYPPSSGIQFFKDEIVFLFPSKNEVNMLPEHISFGSLEAYHAIPGDTLLVNPTIFSQSYPFLYPCEAMTFSPDYNTLYFTKIPRKDKKEKIFQAKYISEGQKNSGWVSEKNAMAFCSENATYTHPTLSGDEKELIFASDKEGSLGGMDLFVTRKEDDIWSTPENLGNLINTTGNEFFPFLDSDNNLYFSSDGHDGYGGLDIFTCKFNGVDWDKPKNLSNRINSEDDDIAFTINKIDGRTAFYTKRNTKGNGEMQLFRVTSKREIADNNLLTIPFIYNGKPILRILTAATPPPEVKVVEVEPPKAEVKKEEVIIPEIIVIPEKKPVIEPAPAVKPPEAKVVIIKPTKDTPIEFKDVVIYRVQYISSTKPQTNNQITIDGKSYETYEYFYLGAYRYTIGEFRTLDPAKALQSACRKSGYPQAFVAAFKNNTRSLDLALFK